MLEGRWLFSWTKVHGLYKQKIKHIFFNELPMFNKKDKEFFVKNQNNKVHFSSKRNAYVSPYIQGIYMEIFIISSCYGCMVNFM